MYEYVNKEDGLEQILVCSNDYHHSCDPQLYSMLASSGL